MTKKILVEGMKCGNCIKHVEISLRGISGVNSVDVNLGKKEILVGISCEVSNEVIENAINSEKYNVVQIETL
ncbi:heavy-metal-associated domain-containing protein [Alkalicella caledoniensis]|uniref:Heavy-metal-associated domain-containing protein n=2 Tax=Alkalicella caledoniensis TaxID=2731377 RepID=A0A7G9WDC1_ALKCA|nr:heavy-metal-associated domain-containing protein [Alkalicella caledoniensis]